MSIDLSHALPGPRCESCDHAPVSPRRAAADTGNGDDSGSEQSAFMGDLEVAGTGETRDDDMLVTPEMGAVVEEAVRRWRGWDQAGLRALDIRISLPIPPGLPCGGQEAARSADRSLRRRHLETTPTWAKVPGGSTRT